MPERVVLSWTEMLLASQAGSMRRIKALTNSSREPHGTPPGDLWGVDIEACGAELAVAKALGIYWESNPADYHSGDVGDHEVRWTPLPAGNLIIRQGDRFDAAYVLVRGRMPLYWIVGWIQGSDVFDRADWIRDPNEREPAWFVPPHVLYPIETLKTKDG